MAVQPMLAKGSKVASCGKHDGTPLCYCSFVLQKLHVLIDMCSLSFQACAGTLTMQTELTL